jgi:hypothetical protein
MNELNQKNKNILNKIILEEKKLDRYNWDEV